MKEFGGYIELEKNRGELLHSKAVALNCGRSCLVYLAKAKKIEKLYIPFFLCDSVKNVCDRENIKTEFYHTDERFTPENLSLGENEWLYIVNYYGQLGASAIEKLREKYERIIVDNAQAYFQEPVSGVDTLYTCRKFFGVADGAFLYTDTRLDEELEKDLSYDRMRFLLGRFEKTASEFYGEYVDNNRLFKNEPVKTMSRLTENLLRGVDYEFVRNRRTENFRLLHNAFGELNKLRLSAPEGAYMYPLYIEGGSEIRKQLQQKKIYIPTLWPYVFETCDEDSREYNMAQNILPLPIDQRYTTEDMDCLVREVLKCIN